MTHGAPLANVPTVFALKCLPYALLVAASSLGCSGRPVPAPIADEPVCSDVEIGPTHTKMRGGLRFPVRVTVREGSTVVMKTLLTGLRAPNDPATRVLLPDANTTISVEWSQCENERAPRPAEAKPSKPGPRDETVYECGNAATYKTDTVETKKGQAATLTFRAPPIGECFRSDIGAASVVPAATASATPAASATVAPSASVNALPQASASAAASPVPTASASAR